MYSNVWVSIAVACFTALSFVKFGEMLWSYTLFTLTATISAYNYMRIVQMPSDLDQKNHQKFWMNTHLMQAVFFTLVFSILSFILFLDFASWRWVWLMAPAVIVSMLYPLGFKNAFRSFTSLRNVPGLKLILISVSWSYVTYIIPVLLMDQLSLIDIIEFIARSFFIAALIIPFDIRDLQIDDEHMRTLPQRLGIKKSRQLAILFSLIYMAWKLFEYNLGLMEIGLLASWFVAVAYVIFLVARMNGRKSELYCGFWIEATPIIATLTILVLQLI